EGLADRLALGDRQRLVVPSFAAKQLRDELFPRHLLNRRQHTLVGDALTAQLHQETDGLLVFAHLFSFLTALKGVWRGTFRRRFHPFLQAGQRCVMRQVKMQRRHRNVAVTDRAYVRAMRWVRARTLKAEPIVRYAARVDALDDAGTVIIPVALARNLDARNLK